MSLMAFLQQHLGVGSHPQQAAPQPVQQQQSLQRGLPPQVLNQSPRLITDTGDINIGPRAPYPNILKGMVFGNNAHPAGQPVPMPQVQNNIHNFRSQAYVVKPNPQSMVMVPQSPFNRTQVAQPAYMNKPIQQQPRVI